MLVALATNPKDINLAFELVGWMRDIQPNYNKHWMLLIGAVTLDTQTIVQLAQHAKTCGFKQVVPIRATEEDPISWPNAANAMWRLAAQYAADQARCKWLWVEPDCAPMQPGWLDQIEDEYENSHKAFMGTIYEQPFKHLNGVAVYPPNIRRYNPLIFNTEFSNMPFDTVRPDLTLRHAHITPLIHRSLADPTQNQAHTFPDEASLSIIPGACALFHGCKDGSLIRRLRGTPDPTSPYAPKVEQPSMIEKIVDTVKRWTAGDAFFHSGNLGDVMYALPAIKALGGGDLIIGPEQRKTAPCAVPIDQHQFEMALPLLQAQPYLKSITFSKTYPTGAHDLNHFRNHWSNKIVKDRHGLDTLCKAHFYELGILNKFSDTELWLTCPNPINTNKIVIHRSPRYNAPTQGSQAFPWKRLVDKHHEEMMFVGLQTEYETFMRTFETKVSFWKVASFMELAQLIAGSRCFIGNQSFPLSVAIGLGKRVLVEALPRSPDCRFARENYRDQLQGGIEI